MAGERWVALVMDGKTFAADQLVIALGVTVQGEKRVLGLVQTATENRRVCAAFLREFEARGFAAPVSRTESAVSARLGGEPFHGRRSVRLGAVGRCGICRGDWSERLESAGGACLRYRGFDVQTVTRRLSRSSADATYHSRGDHQVPGLRFRKAGNDADGRVRALLRLSRLRHGAAAETW